MIVQKITQFSTSKIAATSALAGVLLLGGCTAPGPNGQNQVVTPGQRTAIGAGLGAAAGALIGSRHDSDRALKGALIGAAAGGGIGYALDVQARKMQQLANQNPELGIGVTRLADGSVKVNIPSDVTYAVDSDQLSQSFNPIIAQIADILNQETSTIVQVVGHADSTGAASYNMDLSERRARNFGYALVNNGVAQNRIYTLGKGESEPVASNDTEAGRKQNRRVEVFIRAPQ